MKAFLTDGKKRGSMTMNEIKEISPLKPPDQTNKFLSLRSRALWFFKKLSHTVKESSYATGSESSKGLQPSCRAKIHKPLKSCTVIKISSRE